MNGNNYPKFNRRLSLVGFALLTILGQRIQAQQVFRSLDDLLTYADQHSATTQANIVNEDLAHLQGLASKANLVNLRGAATFNATNNFALPVNFLPAEIFGGPAGTFREVQFGQQYVSVASIQPQLDLVNPSTWARVKSAELSKELTTTTSQINRRTLHENLATAYANYHSLAAQRSLAQQNINHADSILQITKRRFEAGIIRKQDMNNAEINLLNLIDAEKQMAQKQAIQLLQIGTWIGLSDGAQVALIQPTVAPNPGGSVAEAGGITSTLLSRQAQLGWELQRSELLAQRMNFLPTLSLTAGFNWQKNSNDGFFNDNPWINSQYVGMKLSVPIPTETRLWSSAEEYRLQADLKAIQAKQTEVQEQAQNRQLELDLSRASDAFAHSQKITKLKEENFNSQMASYREGILNTDLILTAFIDLVNAQMSEANARWNLFLQSKRAQINRENP